MKYNWQIRKHDLKRVKAIIESQCGSTFVKERIEWNLDKQYPPPVDENRFWEAMVLALLIIQQRSGPNSAVNRFGAVRPAPLSLQNCSSQSKNLSRYVERTLKKFGGIRRIKRIGDEITHNHKWLVDAGWKQIMDISRDLNVLRMKKASPKAIPVERKAARFVAQNLKGFGPKQSRNLWQALGLFRYEIPLDSRITKWLNANKIFPFELSATALQDRNYYEFVMSGIQELCVRCNVLPCILDAAIFSSYDQ